MQEQHALITGGAGFIGSQLADSLLADGWKVTVLDNFDPFYPEENKRQNIAHNLENPDYSFIRGDVRDQDLTGLLPEGITHIMHIAAKAGVRPSILDPITYQDVNVAGTQNLLEFARIRGVGQFVFASSSSVYGINPNVPWSEEHAVLKPISPYASTKVSGELLGHVYSHLYGIRFVALRFFTVYGPRQRPDLAINKFTRLIRAGEPIPVFGDGSTRRDYTFIYDLLKGIKSALRYDQSMYEVINIGNNQTVTLAELIAALESVIGKKAIINRLPEQPGDVPQTFANIEKAGQLLDYHPRMKIEEGLGEYYQWVTERSETTV